MEIFNWWLILEEQRHTAHGFQVAPVQDRSAAFSYVFSTSTGQVVSADFHRDPFHAIADTLIDTAQALQPLLYRGWDETSRETSGSNRADPGNHLEVRIRKFRGCHVMLYKQHDSKYLY